MQVNISAIFDNTDMADIALRRIKENGVPVISAKIKNTDKLRDSDDAEDTFLAYPQFNGGYYDSFSRFGPPLMISTTPPMNNYDVISDEVMLILRTEKEACKRAMDLIVNSHGRALVLF